MNSNGRCWPAIFFCHHHCQTPYFSEIPEEFIDFLQNRRNNAEDLPFMAELAHYEWVEMALAISPDHLVINAEADNLAQRAISLSALAWPLAYQYPVHKIAPDFIPRQPPETPTCLVVHRTSDDQVAFMEITPFTYRLLVMIQQQDTINTSDCLQALAVESGHPHPALIHAGGLDILQNLAAKQIITVL